LFPISSKEFAETVHPENKSFAGNVGIGTARQEKPALIYNQQQEWFSYLGVHVQSSDENGLFEFELKFCTTSSIV